MNILIFIGHEALSSLVDVAVQQPLLPVPHKDDKGRNPTPTEQMIAFQQIRQVRLGRKVLPISGVSMANYHLIAVGDAAPTWRNTAANVFA